MKQIIRGALALPDRLYNWFLLKRNHVRYGNKLRIKGRLWCVSNTKDGICLGDGVRINSSMKSNPIGGSARTILFAKGAGKIRIGSRTGISNACLFACESITVGEDVFIGGDVRIYDNDFHWLDAARRIREPGSVTRPVVIKDRAFIGAGSFVLKGVTVGKESIVGAGSVVTKDVPDGEIWAGNPARFVSKVTKE